MNIIIDAALRVLGALLVGFGVWFVVTGMTHSSDIGLSIGALLGLGYLLGSD